MQKTNQINISILIGVLTSLVAQGIWSITYAWATGHILDLYLGATFLLIIVASILDFLVFRWLKRLIKKDNDITGEVSEKDLMKTLNAILEEQQKTNDYLKAFGSESIKKEKLEASNDKGLKPNNANSKRPKVV